MIAIQMAFIRRTVDVLLLHLNQLLFYPCNDMCHICCPSVINMAICCFDVIIYTIYFDGWIAFYCYSPRFITIEKVLTKLEIKHLPTQSIKGLEYTHGVYRESTITISIPKKSNLTLSASL